MKTNKYLKPLPSCAWVCFFNETKRQTPQYRYIYIYIYMLIEMCTYTIFCSKNMCIYIHAKQIMPDGDLSPHKNSNLHATFNTLAHVITLSWNPFPMILSFPPQDKYHTVPNQQSILPKLPGNIRKIPSLSVVHPFPNKSGQFWFHLYNLNPMIPFSCGRISSIQTSIYKQ